MNFHYHDTSKKLQGHITKYWVAEYWQSCTISETVQFSIYFKESAEIATLLQQCCWWWWH